MAEDDHSSIDNTGDAGGTGVSAPIETQDTPETQVPDTETQVSNEDHAKPRLESTSDSIRRAIKELNERGDQPKPGKGKKSQAKAGATGDAAVQKDSADHIGNTATAPQAQSGAPQAWKAEERAVWDSLPEVARNAILRREADTTKGVQELRQRYTDIDAAVAPFVPTMRQHNVSPAQAISQLFKWHMELAGPNKVQAWLQLGKNFGIDPATAGAPQITQGAPNGTGGQIPDNLKPVIEGLENRIKGFEQSTAAQNHAAAAATWANWSKDKTHAETVRGLMAQLINADLSLIQGGQPQVSNTIKNGSIDMDAAYQAAIYAHPQVRQIVLQEEQAKRDKAAADAAAKARKASSSMKPGSPSGRMTAGSTPPRSESPRESIERAMRELQER